MFRRITRTITLQLGLVTVLLALSTASALGYPTPSRDHPYAIRSHPYAVTTATPVASPSPAVANATAGRSHLPAGHHAASRAVDLRQLTVAKPKRSSSDGVPAATVFTLMGLALLAGAMIAIWAAARAGHVTRERTASR